MKLVVVEKICFENRKKSLLIEQFFIQALWGLRNEMLQQSVSESIFVFIGASDDRENKKKHWEKEGRRLIIFM